MENQLNAEMKMGLLDIIRIFLCAVSCASKIADYIPGLNLASYLEIGLIRIIFPQMSVIVIPLLVKGTNADAPAPVLIPAKGFYRPGFNGNDGSAYLAHHIMPQMLALVAVISGGSKVIVICIRESFSDRREGF